MKDLRDLKHLASSGADQVKDLLRDFKYFALSGNVVDLAIGVILAAAFGKVVDTFANGILLGLIGAIFQVPDPSDLAFMVGKTPIMYGEFLSALINFLLIAMVLLLLVKALMRVGMNFRAQGNRECDYCKEFVPVDAVKCKFCTSDIEPLITD